MAQPPPATEQTFARIPTKEELPNLSVGGPVPPGYLGIHLAPATHRTVVTTTTTTVVSFPPVLIPRPPSPKLLPESEAVHERAWGGRGRTTRTGVASAARSEGPDGAVRLDPRLYPLAGIRLPDDWKSRGFAMQVGASELPTRLDPGMDGAARLLAQEGDVRMADVPSTSAPPRKRPRMDTPPPTEREPTYSIPLPSRLSPERPPRPRPAGTAGAAASAEFLPSPLLSPSMQTGSGNAFEAAYAAPASPAASQDSDEEASHPATAFASGAEVSTLMALPSIARDFGGLDANLQKYTLFQLLRLSSTPVLQFVSDLVGSALKRDFLADLPPEIAVLVLSELDGTALCRASRVSRTWRQLVDGEWRVWKGRLVAEGLWIGDGHEESEAVRVMREEAGDLDRRSDFVRRWEAGVWDRASYDARTRTRRDAGYMARKDLWKPLDPFVDRHMEPGPSKGGPRWKAGEAPAAVKQEDDVEATATHAPASPASQPGAVVVRDRVTADGLVRAGHFIHKYKLLYRKRFLMRRNWRENEPKQTKFAGHGTNVVTCLQFDRTKIVSASDEYSVNLFEMSTGRRIRSFDGHEGGVWALQYVGNMLVTGSTDRTIRVWDMSTGRNTHTFLGHTSTVRCLQIVEPVNVNPDKNAGPIWEPAFPVVVTGSRDRTCRVWRLPSPFDDSYQADYTCPIDEEVTLEDARANPFHLHCLVGHEGAVRSLSAHGRTLVSGSYDNTIRAWDIVDGQCKHVLRGHEEKVYAVALDPARRRCASGSLDTTVRIWDLERGECLHVLRAHTSLVGLLGLSHKVLISAAADSTLRVWDPDTGECLNQFAAHSGAITCFRHDNGKIVSGSDGIMKMWDVAPAGTTTGNNGGGGGAGGRDLLSGLNGVWQVDFDERYCVAAVQRNNASEFEILDFGPVVSTEHEGLSDFVETKVSESEDEGWPEDDVVMGKEEDLSDDEPARDEAGSDEDRVLVEAEA